MQRSSLLTALLIAVTVALFWPVYSFDFVWDDYVNIVDNPFMANPSWSSVVRFWTKPFFYLYVPLTYTVWVFITRAVSLWNLVEASAGPMAAGPYHLANLLLHILAVLVVFAILKKLVRRDWPAAAGAMLFAVHPMQIEPVAWVTGLKDVLAGLLSLLAVWQYLSYAVTTVAVDDLTAGDNIDKARKPSGHDATSARRRRIHYGLATAAFALALLAKPAAAMLPAALWVLDRCVIGRSMRDATRSLSGWLLLVLLVMVLAKMAQTEELVTYITPLWFRPLLFADAVGFYLFKLIVPLRLGVDYGRSAEWVVQEGWLEFFWLLPLVLAVFVWFERTRRPWLVPAAGLFVIGIIPVSGLVLFAFQEISVVADRYLYFSMLGPALALASLLSERGGKPALAITAALLSLLAIKSAAQVQLWRDESTLFTHALAVNPRSWLARNNLANDSLKHGKIDEALARFEQVLLQKPQLADTIITVGNILADQGKLDEAVVRYQEALRQALSLRLLLSAARAHTELANVFIVRGDVEEATRHYREALRNDPEYFPAHQNLGILLFNRGQIDAAIPHLETALNAGSPSLAVYNNLAIALAKSGRIDEAVQHLRTALRMNPKDADAHNNLGIILAGTGQVEDGAAEFREAARLRPDFAQAHENLSRAMGILGKPEDAARHHQEALRIEAARRASGAAR